MKDKAEVYNKINSKGYLKFELNESNEKEYLDKLKSVQKALKEVEEKNKAEYEKKIKNIENIKEDVKSFYKYIENVLTAGKNVEGKVNDYFEQYVEPINRALTRREKLQLQVVPYVTNGFWKRFKAIFTYEGRARLNIEKQFNKELKETSKDLKNLELLKEKNPLIFEDDGFLEKVIIGNVDIEFINSSNEIPKEKIAEIKSNIKVSKDIVIKTKKNDLINNLSNYIEVCTDYDQIEDLNIDEHYKFKNTEYKLYFQNGYLDNDCNSFIKYIDMIKNEKDFIGEEAANRLISGIQECINDLEEINNSDKEVKNEKLA